MPDFSLSQEVAPPSGRLAGAMLVICATLTLVAISHHPAVVAGPAYRMMAELASQATVDRVVHATLIALLCGSAYALCIYSLRRRQRRLTVIAAFMAYALGVALNVVAALLDGFIVPGLAERYLNAGDELQRGVMPALAACAISIQVFSKAGLTAMSAGILAWSSDLLPGGTPSRMVGMIGVVASAFPLFFFPQTRLEPHLLLGITVLQSLWYAPLGVLLIAKRV